MENGNFTFSPSEDKTQGKRPLLFNINCPNNFAVIYQIRREGTNFVTSALTHSTALRVAAF